MGEEGGAGAGAGARLLCGVQGCGGGWGRDTPVRLIDCWTRRSKCTDRMVGGIEATSASILDGAGRMVLQRFRSSDHGFGTCNCGYPCYYHFALLCSFLFPREPRWL